MNWTIYLHDRIIFLIPDLASQTGNLHISIPGCHIKFLVIFLEFASVINSVEIVINFFRIRYRFIDE